MIPSVNNTSNLSRFSDYQLLYKHSANQHTFTFPHLHIFTLFNQSSHFNAPFLIIYINPQRKNATNITTAQKPDHPSSLKLTA